MSLNTSTGRDATYFRAISERREHIGIIASFENISERNNKLHVLNVNNQTRNKTPDEACELSVPRTRFDKQPNTHHRNVSLEPVPTFSWVATNLTLSLELLIVRPTLAVLV